MHNLPHLLVYCKLHHLYQQENCIIPFFGSTSTPARFYLYHPIISVSKPFTTAERVTFAAKFFENKNSTLLKDSL